MDNTQCSSTPLASEVMITAVMLIFWLRAPAFGPFERWDVVDLFAGQARIARLARQYGQSSIAMDIGYHEDPHIFDINSEPGFVYLSLGNRQNYFLFVEFGSLSSSSWLLHWVSIKRKLYHNFVVSRVAWNRGWRWRVYLKVATDLYWWPLGYAVRVGLQRQMDQPREVSLHRWVVVSMLQLQLPTKWYHGSLLASKSYFNQCLDLFWKASLVKLILWYSGGLDGYGWIWGHTVIWITTAT